MSIRIDITPLLKSVGRTIKINEEEKASYPEDNLIFMDPVKVTGELTNTGDTILFEGKVSTAVRMSCGRCLKEYTQPLEFGIEEEYAKKGLGKKAQKNEIELGENDFVYEVGSDNKIDLSEVIRQNILIEVPIQPLCEECKGKEFKEVENAAT